MGGINIDGCRIGVEQTKTCMKDLSQAHGNQFGKPGIVYPKMGEKLNPPGRWPANILFDEEAAEMLGEPNRFFYCAKASSAERNRGCEGLPLKDSVYAKNAENGEGLRVSDSKLPKQNFHPTIKPLALLEYLLKLIAPPQNALILDPFAGSGSTCVAAKKLGLECVGIEISEEYCKIAQARIDSVKQDPQLELFNDHRS